jgi:hypothetical protein
MSTATVTPIRGSSGGPPKPPGKPPAKPRYHRPPSGVHLRESDEFDGYSTLDVVNGLHGVCLALDICADNRDVNRDELAIAARVLSSILQRRVD